MTLHSYSALTDKALQLVMYKSYKYFFPFFLEFFFKFSNVIISFMHSKLPPPHPTPPATHPHIDISFHSSHRRVRVTCTPDLRMKHTKTSHPQVTASRSHINKLPKKMAKAPVYELINQTQIASVLMRIGNNVRLVGLPQCVVVS